MPRVFDSAAYRFGGRVPRLYFFWRYELSCFPRRSRRDRSLWVRARVRSICRAFSEACAATGRRSAWLTTHHMGSLRVVCSSVGSSHTPCGSGSTVGGLPKLRVFFGLRALVGTGCSRRRFGSFRSAPLALVHAVRSNYPFKRTAASAFRTIISSAAAAA